MSQLTSSLLERPAPPTTGGAAATLYKGLGRYAESIFGGRASWNLPSDSAPGAWMPPVARLSPGAVGYHLTGAGDLLRCWLAPRLFVAEGRGASVVTPNGATVVFQQARLVRELSWNRGVALHWYRDCLEFAVAEARAHRDFVDEARHRRLLADACSWPSDCRWHDMVRLGLAELAVALGDAWYRDQRRRQEPASLPRRAHIERVHNWQARRLLGLLDDRIPTALQYALA